MQESSNSNYMHWFYVSLCFVVRPDRECPGEQVRLSDRDDTRNVRLLIWVLHQHLRHRSLAALHQLRGHRRSVGAAMYG